MEVREVTIAVKEDNMEVKEVSMEATHKNSVEDMNIVLPKDNKAVNLEVISSSKPGAFIKASRGDNNILDVAAGAMMVVTLQEEGRIITEDSIRARINREAEASMGRGQSRCTRVVSPVSMYHSQNRVRGVSLKWRMI